jgi:uncharacterized damage-inducible protein DinB
MSESSEVSHPSHLELLLRYLQREREGLIGTLDGLSDYDVRRPIVPSGTSLLGLVKHVATVELGYFGECVGRPWPEPIPWESEEAFERGEDMYALADESREMLLDLYRRSWAFCDQNIRELGLEAPAQIPWWPADRTPTTVGYVLVHMLSETAHHAGHADILRESIDGRGGRDHDDVGDTEHWSAFVAKIQAAADAHRPG